MPRFRFNIRSLLIVVAIAAVIFFGETMRRRRVSHLKRAAFEIGLVQTHLKEADACDRSAPKSDRTAELERRAADTHRQAAEAYRQQKVSATHEASKAEILRTYSEKVAAIHQRHADELRLLSKRNRAQAEYHGALGRKYQIAAGRPWWRVAPDPLEPDWNTLWPAEIEEPASLPPENLPVIVPGDPFMPKP